VDLLKVILRKSLSPMQRKTEDGSFYITFADYYNDVDIIDHYDRVEVSLLDKWHGYRSSFKKDAYVDGYTVDLCVPKESESTKFIADIVKAVNKKEKSKYDDYDFTVVFYNIADERIKEFVNSNMEHTNQKMVENYYDWVNGAIHHQVDKAKEECKIQPHCGCAVYLSFGSSEAVAVYYVKRDPTQKNEIDNFLKKIRMGVCDAEVFLEQRILTINKDPKDDDIIKLIDPDDVNNKNDGANSDDGNQLWEEIQKSFNAAYTKLAHGDHKAHRRVQNAMDDILNIYNQISQSEHSHDIVSTLGAFLRCFLSSLTKIIENINSGKDGIACEIMYKNSGDPVNINEYSSFVEGSICAVREALSPLWHSEHAFYDDQRLIRHAVGGLIKLLYAYNDMLFMWNDIYSDENKYDPILNFATSGGVDIITNQDLFNYNQNILKTDNKPIERPIAVTVPEASLWDITGSIYRIAHEFFHVRGEKCRDERAEMYLDGLFNIFAEYCYDTVIEEILRIKAKNLFDNLIMQTELKSGYSQFDKSAAFEKFLEDVESAESVEHNGERLPETLGDIRTSLIDLRKKLIRDIDKEIVDKYIDSVVTYLKHVYINNFEQIKDEYLIDLRYNASILLANALEKTVNDINGDICGNIVDDSIDNNAVAVYNKKLMTEIARAMNSIDGGTDAPYSLYDIVFSSTSVKPHVATIYKCAIENYFNNNGSPAQSARYLIEKVMPGLYKECVADCLAIKASGLDAAENGFIRYILCMLYEKRSLVEFFYNAPEQYDLFMILRLGVVKDVCELKYDEKSAVKYISDFYRDIMFPHLLETKGADEAKGEAEAFAYAVALKDHIQDITDIYISYKNRRYIAGLKDYLKNCVDANSEKCNEIKQKIGYDVKDIENEINGNEYVNFAFAHWLRLYGDRK